MIDGRAPFSRIVSVPHASVPHASVPDASVPHASVPDVSVRTLANATPLPPPPCAC